MTVATYNVHGYVGADGRFDPGRVVGVIRELKAEVIGLQEVYASSETGGWGAHMEYLSEVSGLQALPGPTMVREDSDFGNVLLTNFPILQTDNLDLSICGREPRGAIDAILEIKSRPVRVIVTHLGLRGKERLCQTEQLACKVEEDRNPLLILLGDINEWYPLSRSLRYLNRCFGKSPVRPTFPARWPVLPLDRIWVCPSNALLRVWTHRNPLSRLASDHLPLKAEIGLMRTTESRLLREACYSQRSA
jgi:endonuclease/exonuclease/phosphatase family metal-dependent hydrolase